MPASSLGRRRSRPVADAPALDGADLAKAWLVELVAVAPLERATRLPGPRFGEDAPRLCAALAAALASDAALDDLEPGGTLAPLASGAGHLAAAPGPHDAVDALECLRGVVWAALLEEVHRPAPRQVADLADRLGTIIATLTTATLEAASNPLGRPGDRGPLAAVLRDARPAGPTAPVHDLGAAFDAEDDEPVDLGAPPRHLHGLDGDAPRDGAWEGDAAHAHLGDDRRAPGTRDAGHAAYARRRGDDAHPDFDGGPADEPPGPGGAQPASASAFAPDDAGHPAFAPDDAPSGQLDDERFGGPEDPDRWAVHPAGPDPRDRRRSDIPSRAVPTDALRAEDHRGDAADLRRPDRPVDVEVVPAIPSTQDRRTPAADALAQIEATLRDAAHAADPLAEAAARLRALAQTTDLDLDPFDAAATRLRSENPPLAEPVIRRMPAVEDATELAGARATPWAASIERRVTRHQADGLPFAVLCLELADADRLLAGDPDPEVVEAIEAAEAAILTQLRPADALIRERPGRYWLTTPDTDATDARGLAHRIAGAIEDLPTHRGVPHQVAAGVVTCPADATETAEIERLADEAQFSARASGHRVSGPPAA